jgi:hypothetical protein
MCISWLFIPDYLTFINPFSDRVELLIDSEISDENFRFLLKDGSSMAHQITIAITGQLRAAIRI